MTHPQIDQLHAAVFDSDMLHSYDNRRDLRRAMESWIQAIDAFEEFEGRDNPPEKPKQDVPAYWQSRSMFVARLQAMDHKGDKWLSIQAVLALLNDCDMIVAQPEYPSNFGNLDGIASPIVQPPQR